MFVFPNTANFPRFTCSPTSFLRPVFFFIAIILALTAAGTNAAAQSSTPRLRVSSDRHFLEKADGTPFFWLGDTAWFLPKMSQTDIDNYFYDTASKKFNGVLIDVGYYFFEPVGDPPFLGDEPDSPNPVYWNKVDWMVTRAQGHGLYTALVVMWGPDYYTRMFNDPARSYRFGKWLGQRYGWRDNVVWVVSGEYNLINTGQVTMFDNMARGIRDGGGNQLMTIHPGTGSSSTQFHPADWLDFNILQSGWAANADTLGIENYQVIERDFRLSPVKPTMEGEPPYEAVILDWNTARDPNGPRVGSDMVRRKAYWGVFAGGAGHNYGHKSIENSYDANAPSPYYVIGYAVPDFKDALNAVGRSQMRYLRTLVESRPILGRIPDQSVIASNAGTGDDHMVATRASNGSFAWVYIPTGGAATIRMSALAGPQVNASWYNPRDGSYTFIGQVPNAGALTFDAPGPTAAGNDWVLVLDSVGPGTDTTPPVVSAMFANNIGSSTASINWTTNEPADSQVEFIFPCPSTGCLGAVNSSLTTSHVINVGNLATGTQYTYRVRSRDAAGNLSVSLTDAFTTSLSATSTPPAGSTAPVGNWKLNEGSGPYALDSSGNGYNGTLVNGPVWTTSAARTALQFDAIDDYVDVGNPSGLQLTGAMTVSAWVNTKSITYNGRIVSKGGAPGVRGWSLNVENVNAFEFSIAASASGVTPYVDSTSGVPLNTWVHVAGVYEPGTALRIYVNGALNNSNTTGIPASQFNPSVNLRIGARADGYSFDGMIDEVRVYNRALSSGEVQQLYSDTQASASDATPPVISGVSASNISSSTAAISWTTNEAADGQVQFLSPCPSSGCLSSIVTALTTFHAIDLANLAASTTYSYRVLSKDAAGNLATGGTNTFTTQAPPSAAPGSPANLSAVCNGATQVVLNWSAVATATSYYLRVNDVANGNLGPYDYTVDSLDTTSFTANVKSGHDYIWWVHAGNAQGLSKSTLSTFSCPSFTNTPQAPTDNTAPTFSSLSAGNITSSTATITWVTNELADGQVEFISPCPATGCLTTLVPAFSTSHTIDVSSLAASTTYTYRVRSKDVVGNVGISGNQTFTTNGGGAPAPAGAPSSPTNLAVSCSSPTQAVLSWAPVSTAVSYYLRVNDLANSSSTPYDYTIDGLGLPTFTANVKAGHNYIWWVHAANAFGLSKSTISTFTCAAAGTTPPADTTAPAIASISVGVTASTAAINWTTNEPADGQVEFISPCPSTGCLTTLVSALSTAHTINVSNLAASTTYTYRIRSKDAAGNTGVSTNQIFSTSAAVVTPPAGAPSSPTNLVSFCNSPTQVVLTWSPVSTATSYYLRVNDLANSSSTPYDYIVDGLGVTTYTASVRSGHDYIWWVHAANSFGLSTSTRANFTCSLTAPPPPSATTPPTISSISVTNITPSTASINWLTSEPADSQVEFISPCPSNGCFTPIVATLSTSRTVDVANLAGSTTYAYRVRSKDAAGNTAVSANQTFTTSAAPVLPPTGPPSAPSSIAAVCIGGTQVTLTWPIVPTATAYYLRINDLANDSSTPYDYTLDGLEAPSFTANVKYAHDYIAWVHAGNSIGLSSSARVFFSCPSAAPPPPPSAPSDTTAPTISPLTVSDITTSSASVHWTTNEPADGQVEFIAPCPLTGCLTPIVTALTTSHTVSLANLAASTTYTYRVRSTDAAGNATVSANHAFTTATPPVITPTTPPARPANLASVCNSATQVTLSWPQVPTATSYYLRVKDVANNSSDPLDYSVDEWDQTSFTATVKDGHEYVWWVHAANGVGLSLSQSATFSCP